MPSLLAFQGIYVYILPPFSVRKIPEDWRETATGILFLHLIMYLYNQSEICFLLEERGGQWGWIFLYFFIFFLLTDPKVVWKLCQNNSIKRRHLEVIREARSGQWLKQDGISAAFFFFFLSQFLSQSDTTLNQSNKTSDSYEYSRKKILATSYPSWRQLQLSPLSHILIHFPALFGRVCMLLLLLCFFFLLFFFHSNHWKILAPLLP